VGLAREARKQAVGVSNKSHTEFTRLVSEHGLFGVGAVALMIVMGINAFRQQPWGWPRAFSASLVAFGFLFMSGSGMRLAIPSFLLALAGVRISLPAGKPRSVNKPRRQITLRGGKNFLALTAG
jgi:hypothetical protein